MIAYSAVAWIGPAAERVRGGPVAEPILGVDSGAFGVDAVDVVAVADGKTGQGIGKLRSRLIAVSIV